MRVTARASRTLQVLARALCCWPIGLVPLTLLALLPHTSPLRAGKREYATIGGQWGPQDGGHPSHDPRALSRTAARHFAAATGVDLSRCSQWWRLAEFSYLRPGSSSAPERREHSVVFLVDAWALAAPSPEAEAQLAKARTAGDDEDRLRWAGAWGRAWGRSVDPALPTSCGAGHAQSTARAPVISSHAPRIAHCHTSTPPPAQA